MADEPKLQKGCHRQVPICKPRLSGAPMNGWAALQQLHNDINEDGRSLRVDIHKACMLTLDVCLGYIVRVSAGRQCATEKAERKET